MDNEKTPRRGYPWWGWLIAALLFWPALFPMLVGYAIPGTRRYLGAPGVIIASIAPFVVLGVVVAVTSTPDEESGRQQLEVREVATATPKPTPTPKSPGIGVSRQSVQSTLEEFDFTFDQPRLMRDGEWIVDGRTSEGRGIVSLVGPADELNRAWILIEGGQTIDFLEAAIFLAVVAPGLGDEAPIWMENNAEKAVRWGGVSTTRQGVKITMDVTLELGWFELTVEPE